MARKTRAQALVTREQLLDAAERVFRERGVGHTSLAEVSDAAGVTRGAVYWHFKNKTDLFKAMVARAEMSHDRSLQEMEAATQIDPLEAVRAGAINALSQFASDQRARDVFEIVFLRCEYTKELASVQRRQRESRLNCYTKIEAALRKAIKRGQLPPHIDARLAARGLYAYIGGLIRDCLEAPEEFDCARDARALINFYIDGLGHAQRKPIRRTAKRQSTRTTRVQRSRG
jgi:TetR/AcrR family acrAB operon transcriptional repressor